MAGAFRGLAVRASGRFSRYWRLTAGAEALDLVVMGRSLSSLGRGHFDRAFFNLNATEKLNDLLLDARDKFVEQAKALEFVFYQRIFFGVRNRPDALA